MPSTRATTLRPGKDALLLVDVVNDLEFSSADKVLPWAERLVRPLRSVCARARRWGIPVVYANDHFGLWQGSREDIVRHCTRKGARGADVARKLKPQRSDYFVIKPRHSAFFASLLHPLLEHLRVERLILCGMVTNMCVVATAHDAKMLGYPIVVLSDCCAAESDFDHNVVLAQLERFFHATICRSSELVAPRQRPGRRRHSR